MVVVLNHFCQSMRNQSDKRSRISIDLRKSYKQTVVNSNQINEWDRFDSMQVLCTIKRLRQAAVLRGCRESRDFYRYCLVLFSK